MGATVGWGTGSSRQFDALGNSSTGYTLSGVLGGLELGYNWQFNQIVLGVEGDFSWTTIGGAGLTTPTFGCLGQQCESSLNWISTQRARIGYLVTNSLLAYATGGAAEVRVETSLPPCPGAAFGGCITAENTRDTWTAGGGLEYMVSPHVTMKAEYLYMNIKQFQWTTFLAGTDPGLTYVHDINIVRAGLNYKF